MSAAPRAGSPDDYESKRSAEPQNHQGFAISSYEDSIQDSKMKNYVNIPNEDLPKIKAILEEAVKIDSITTMEQSLR